MAYGRDTLTLRDRFANYTNEDKEQLLRDFEEYLQNIAIPVETRAIMHCDAPEELQEKTSWFGVP